MYNSMANPMLDKFDPVAVKGITQRWMYDGAPMDMNDTIKMLAPYLIVDKLQEIYTVKHEWKSYLYEERQPYLFKPTPYENIGLIVVQNDAPKFIDKCRNVFNNPVTAKTILQFIDPTTPSEAAVAPPTLATRGDALLILMNMDPSKEVEQSVLAIMHIKTGVAPSNVVYHEIYDVRVDSGQPKNLFRIIYEMAYIELLTNDVVGRHTGLIFDNASGKLVTTPNAKDDITRRENAMFWVGAKAYNYSQFFELVFYESIGFYFPGHMPGERSFTSITHLGSRFDFGFLAGYASANPQWMAFAHSDIGSLIAVSLNSQDVRQLIGDADNPAGPYADFGLLNEEAELAGYFTGPCVPMGVINKLPTYTRGGAGHYAAGGCQVSLPPPPQPPLGNIVSSWHTHPLTCYRSTGYVHGFPSQPDYFSHIITANKKDTDTDMVFAREGVFILQLHPLLKLLIIRSDTVETHKEVAARVGPAIATFAGYLADIEYSKRREGDGSAKSKQISEKLKQSFRLNNPGLISKEDVDYMYELSAKAIPILLSDIAAYTVPYLNMDVPLLNIQVVRREQFSTKSKPAYFFTSKYTLKSKI